MESSSSLLRSPSSWHNGIAGDSILKWIPTSNGASSKGASVLHGQVGYKVGDPTRALQSLSCLLQTLAKYVCQEMFMIRTMSLFSRDAGKLARIFLLKVHAFAFLLSILNFPCCSALSPTCHMYVPYGTPIQHAQGMFDSKVYSRKALRIDSHAHRIGGGHAVTSVKDLQVVHSGQHVGE
jgi:hypothetical protein